LWVVREVQEGMILVVGWLSRVNYKTLGTLLQPVVDFTTGHFSKMLTHSML